ncbi:MAG: hypothetical protein IPO20_08995 [Gammaproteobacteria bacterium]|nr:hypothetical protein [Gammaproteobacteria bacterium]
MTDRFQLLQLVVGDRCPLRRVGTVLRPLERDAVQAAVGIFVEIQRKFLQIRAQLCVELGAERRAALVGCDVVRERGRFPRQCDQHGSGHRHPRHVKNVHSRYSFGNRGQACHRQRAVRVNAFCAMDV